MIGAEHGVKQGSHRGSLGRRAVVLAAGAAALLPRAARAEWLRDEIVVYAEPALRPVLASMAAEFRRQQDIRVRTFCAAPGQMLALLAHNTQDDILIAQTGSMAQAASSGLTASPGRLMWRNRLVFGAAAPGPAATDFDAAGLRTALANGRLALPDPSDASTVDGPALLHGLGAADAVAGRVLGAADSADAVATLKRGEATWALCHASEVAGDPALRVAMRVPDGAYAPITYAAALSHAAWSRYQDAFLAYLAGPAAATARAHGLEVLA